MLKLIFNSIHPEINYKSLIDNHSIIKKRFLLNIRLVFYLQHICALLFFTTVFSQTNEQIQQRKFDSVYYETATRIAVMDVEKALQISDSLFLSASNQVNKVKALMLKSTLYSQKGHMEMAIAIATKAEKIANDHNIYEWQARISGFLSTQFRSVGLYKIGEEYLDKGIIASENLTGNIKNLYAGMVYQEKSIYSLNIKDYNTALYYLNKSDSLFNKLESKRDLTFFLATNEELLGSSYLGLDMYNVSLRHYQNALRLLNKTQQKDNIVIGAVYAGIGGSYIGLKKKDSAFVNLKKAESISESSQSLALKVDLYDAFCDYYEMTGDYDNYICFNQKYKQISKQRLEENEKVVGRILELIKIENSTLYTSKRRQMFYGILVISIVVISFLLYQVKKKKDLERFKEAIKKQKQQLAKENKPSKLTISESIEQKIREGLAEFERSEYYLEKNISLAVLSGIVGVNSKYLSYFLNNYVNSNFNTNDFNTYINALRIKYILKRLESDKEYRKYKISFLAEECGFSSHSKFSATFRTLTNYTPSVYIEYLNKLDKES